MKYIRTKAGIHELMPSLIQNLTMSFDGETIEPAYYTINHEWVAKKDVLKQSDTIKELCDEFLFVNKIFPENDGRGKIRMRSLQKVLRKIYYLKRKLKDFFREENYVVYGTIWVNDELHKVAKMKGILPNGEIDWELL